MAWSSHDAPTALPAQFRFKVQGFSRIKAAVVRKCGQQERMAQVELIWDEVAGIRDAKAEPLSSNRASGQGMLRIEPAKVLGLTMGKGL